ncbi:hypothetical protein PIB30_088842 [Stylosanthes scabra]|uniref:Uncharacterized protein n=1 Tax=Stylosanthes scabra TaxID=79078 RepID=A0ABU6SU50_9FABA|nr:hypothetical protein [Stylosanthes scabra]
MVFNATVDANGRGRRHNTKREGKGGGVDDEDGGFKRWVRWRLKVVAMGVEEEDDGSKARWSSTIGCDDGMEVRMVVISDGGV